LLTSYCPLQSSPLLMMCRCPNVPATSGNIAGSLNVRGCWSPLSCSFLWCHRHQIFSLLTSFWFWGKFMKYGSISTLRFSSSQTLRRRDFLSSLNNRGINFAAIRLVARSSVKIAPDESEDMFTYSAVSRIGKRRSTRFFHALEQPFISSYWRSAWTRIVVQGFSILFKSLSPLINNCLAQTVITEGCSQHLQTFCAGLPILTHLMHTLCSSMGSIMRATNTGNVTELEHVLFATGVWEGGDTVSQCAATLPPQPNTSHKFLSKTVLRSE
jgi:hypothetical protein